MIPVQVSFGRQKVKITGNDKSVERVKLLRLIIYENFKLTSHVIKVLKDGYSTLQTLKLLKQYTTFYQKTILQISNPI